MPPNPYKPFAPYLRPYRRAVLAGLLLLLAEQSIATALPMILRQVIDTVRRSMGGDDGAVGGLVAARAQVALVAAAIAGLGLLQWASAVGMRWFFTSVSRYVERDIRAAYVAHLLRLPLGYFQRHRVGDLMARATNDVEAIQRFLHHAFRMTLTGILAFVLSLGLMCTIDWQLALYALIPMPLMACTTRWVSGRVRDGFRQVQEQFAAMSARIQESLAGVRVVKACAREDHEIATFARLNEDFVARNRRLVNIRSLFFPFTFLLNGVSMVILLWLGGLRVIAGEMSLGSFVAFNAYLIRLGRPMMLLGRMVDEFQRAAASLHRIQHVLGEPPQDAGGTVTAALGGEIEFRGVGFAYDGNPVLRDIHLHVPAGTTLAVVGRVGSGKSTLARLVPRLIEATQGQVLIDGRPIADLPVAQLRAAIGYVPQDSFLFSDSIRANIELGRPEGTSADAGHAGLGDTGQRGADRTTLQEDADTAHAPDSVVRAGFAGHAERTTPSGDLEHAVALAGAEQAAAAAHLTADAAGFPQGLDTLVGERGVTLSGGQKQRAALARALIRQPRILILDDALASVDTHTEEAILGELRRIMARCTTIIIAHRLSTVRDADRIAVLDEGRIAELGTHAELLARNGLYAAMYRRQHLAAELTSL